MIRPTSRAVLGSVVVVAVAAITAGLFPTNWILSLALIPTLLVLILFDAFLTPLRSSLQWDLQLPKILYAGLSDEAVLTATPGRGYIPARVDLICDVNDKIEQIEPQYLMIDGGQQSKLTLPLRPLRRGMGQIERLWLRWDGPFGLVRRITMIPWEEDIRIIPNIKAVRSAAIEFSTRDAMLA